MVVVGAAATDDDDDDDDADECGDDDDDDDDGAADDDKMTPMLESDSVDDELSLETVFQLAIVALTVSIIDGISFSVFCLSTLIKNSSRKVINRFTSGQGTDITYDGCSFDCCKRGTEGEAEEGATIFCLSAGIEFTGTSDSS